VPQLTDLRFYLQHLAHYLQPSLGPSLHCVTGLSHHAPGQPQQLLVTVPHPLSVGLGQSLGGAADLQQTMFHGAPVIHHFQRATFTLGGNTLQAAAEHTDAVAQDRAVGWIVNITLRHRSS
jgi:hypothetical protein